VSRPETGIGRLLAYDENAVRRHINSSIRLGLTGAAMTGCKCHLVDRAGRISSTRSKNTGVRLRAKRDVVSSGETHVVKL
jgi:hypothetical protein